MKIYVITQGEYSEYHIVGVTADEDAARAFVRIHNEEVDDDDGWRGELVEVEEYDTDDFPKLLHPCWEVDAESKDGKGYWTAVRVHFTKYDEMFLPKYVLADDPDTAIKATQDRLAKKLAEYHMI